MWIPLIYLFLALFYLLLAVGNPLTYFIGYSGIDLYKDVWDLWWYKTCLLEEHRIPFYTNLLLYPQGAVNYITDPWGALLSLPLQLWGGLPLAYNFLVCFYLILAAWGAYLLCLEISENKAAAFIGGLIYAYSPYLLSHIHNGMLNMFNIGWLPLYILFLLKSFKAPRLKYYLLAALFFALGSISGWYYGVVMLFMTLICLLFYPHKLGESLKILALSALLASPFLALFLAHLYHPLTARPQRLMLTFSKIIFKATSLNLNNFFIPSPRAINQVLYSQYLSWTVLCLAFWGWLKERSRARLWITLSAFFLLLSLGFFLAWKDYFVTFNHRLIPLPFFALYKYLPGFKLFWYPYRMLPGALLGLAVLASLGMKAILQKYPLPQLFILVLSLLILIEYLTLAGLPFPPQATPAALPSLYQQISSEAENFGIIELPFIGTTKSYLENYSYYFYTQTAHRHPMPLNFNCEIPDFFFRNPLTQFLMGQETLKPTLPLPPPDTQRLKSGALALKKLGFKYLILHTEEYPPLSVRYIKTALNPILPPPLELKNLLRYNLQESE
jgi:hypothetical protein